MQTKQTQLKAAPARASITAQTECDVIAIAVAVQSYLARMFSLLEMYGWITFID